MKIYIGIHLPTGENHKLEGKREANVLAKHPDYNIWELEGRKGKQINQKLQTFYQSMLNGESPPIWCATYYFPQAITRTRSKEHNEKIRTSMSGKSKSEEHKQAISLAMRGNRNRN